MGSRERPRPTDDTGTCGPDPSRNQHIARRPDIERQIGPTLSLMRCDPSFLMRRDVLHRRRRIGMMLTPLLDMLTIERARHRARRRSIGCLHLLDNQQLRSRSAGPCPSLKRPLRVVGSSQLSEQTRSTPWSAGTRRASAPTPAHHGVSPTGRAAPRKRLRRWRPRLATRALHSRRCPKKDTPRARRWP